MCSEIWNISDGTEITSIGELREVCSYIAFWPEVDASDVKDDECLCTVDIPLTLVGGGFKVWLEPENATLGIFSAERVTPCSAAPTAS